MTPAPEGWLRVLVRSSHPGDLRPYLEEFVGVAFRPDLGAWVVEPPISGHRAPDAAGVWRNIPDPAERRRIETRLRSMKVPCRVEWQTDGPSQLPRVKEDVRPTVHTNRGWTRPKWEDDR